MNLDNMMEALQAASTAKRRDDCGDMAICGKAGKIYHYKEGFYLYCDPGSARAWGFVKKALDFCDPLQDSDVDGFLILRRLPTAEEATVIRDKLVIRKRRTMTEAELNRLLQTGFKRKEA